LLPLTCFLLSQDLDEVDYTALSRVPSLKRISWTYGSVENIWPASKQRPIASKHFETLETLETCQLRLGENVGDPDGDDDDCWREWLRGTLDSPRVLGDVERIYRELVLCICYGGCLTMYFPSEGYSWDQFNVNKVHWF